MAFIKTYRTK